MVVIAVAGVLVAGCGSGDSPPSASTTTPEPAAATPTPTPAHADRRAASRRATRAPCVEYYGGGEAPVPTRLGRRGRVPPAAAPGDRRIGDTITLTGTNIGVRLDTTVTGSSTPLETAQSPRAGQSLCRRRPAAGQHRHRHPRQPARERAPALRPAVQPSPSSASRRTARTASTGIVRIEVGPQARGCLLFEVPESAAPAAAPARARARAGRRRRPLEAGLMLRNSTCAWSNTGAIVL